MKISNNKFNEKLLKFSLHGVYVFDLIKGQNIYVNSQYTQLTGYTFEAISKLSEEDFCNLFRTDKIRSTSNHTNNIKALKGDEILELEYQFKKADGSWMWCRSRESIFDIDTNGATTQYMGSFADITKEKENEEKADYLNQQLTLSMETASLVIFEILVHDDSIKWIGDISKIYGCTADQISTYTKWTTFVHPDDLIALAKKFELTTYKDKNQEIMYRVTDTNNKLHYVQSTFRAIFDGNGEVARCVGTNKDITEEIRKNETLSATRKKLVNTYKLIRNDQQQLQNYFDTIPSIILILNKQGKVKIINDFACKLYGYKKEEMTGKYFPSNFVPKRLATKNSLLFLEIINGSLEDDKKYSENLALCKDGSERLIAWNTSHSFDNEGNIIGIISTGDDITKRARKKEKVLYLMEFVEVAIEAKSIDKVLLKALQSICAYTNWPVGHVYYPDSAKEKLNPSEIWYTTGKKDYKSFKEATLKTNYLLGEGLLGTAWKEQKAVWKKDFKLKGIFKREEEARKYGLTGAFSFPVSYKNEVVAVFEFFYKNSKNERIDLLDEFIKDLQEQLTLIIDREKFQQEIKEARLEAERANNAKSKFLAYMSHEIRTPMNTILGHAQILSREKGISIAQKNSLESINKSGNHLLGLINDMLNLSKIETGKMQLSYNSFEPVKLLQELIEIFRFELSKKGLKLLTEGMDELPYLVHTDEKKVRQILINLLSNAVKFTDNGSILINTSVKDGIISIAVNDTGSGVSEENLLAIFNSFEQTKDGIIKGGTGLGLAISKKLARLLKGDLTVKSKYGKGSSFVLTFPYLEVDNRILLREDTFKEVDCIKKGQPLIKILVVDDILENREILEILLRSIGFEVKSAINGKNGVNLFQRWLPDVVLMDLVMPTINGIDATTKIRRLKNGKKVGIIGISASAFNEEKKLFIDCGANSFIKKPFKLSELLHEIQVCTGVEYDYSFENLLDNEVADLQTDMDSINALPIDVRDKIKKSIVQGDIEELEVINQQLATSHKKASILISNYLVAYNLESLEELFKEDK
ncbi:MAG: PAS domain S-box-containing protein [Vicingaceae bacterium]|jgi:PAS domain S-box-containing protein